MRWDWCYLDGQCWATWFWSPATAAWIQVLVTATAIIASGWLGRKAFRDTVELDRQKVHMAQLQSIGRFKVAVNSSISELGQFLRDCDQNGKIPQLYFGVVASNLRKTEELVRALLHAALPSVHLMRDMLAVANALHSVSLFLDEIAAGVAHPRLDLPTEMHEDLVAYQDKLEVYHRALGSNGDATWDYVHPGDTGFAHERRTDGDN